MERPHDGPARPPASDRRSPALSRPARSLVPAAEVALAAVSVATVAGLWRLFADGTFFGPLLLHAVAAHALAAACRRRGLAPAVSGVVVAVAAVLALTWTHLAETTALGLPTGETVRVARLRLDEAWELFHEVRAPAPVVPGFLLAAGAALWAGAALADLAAFRLWTPFEALIPSGTVFVFASLFAADRARSGAAALWLAAALAFVLVHRAARQHTSPAWLGSDPRLGTASLLRVGSGLIVLAVLGAWVAGPRLPGADDVPVVAVGELDGGGGSRQTVSPLVEIKRRLVEQSEQELFTVKAPQRAYWRLTALDRFDGEIWRSDGSFGDGEGELDELGPAPPNATAVTQEVTVSALAALWLPAAFTPVRVDAPDAEIRWEPESSTLIVATDHPTSDGLTYEVVSAVPLNPTPDQLRTPPPTPDELARVGNLELPPGFPVSVVDEARRVVAEAGAVAPYDIALALQQYFRNGAFTYDLSAPPGHSDSAIEDFLFVTRAGYCEQFAGTYAAMARAVGLPARVAVGFTPGIRDSVDPTLYRVRGEHAHAWPEVWIPGAGWMAFEPTPGRGAPNTESYTGVPESQDEAGPSTAPTTVPTTIVDPTATTAPGGGPSTTAPPVTDVTEPDPLTDPGGDGSDAGRVLEWMGWALLIVAAGGALLVVAGAGVAGYRALRRWRRRAAAHTPDAKVRAAWADAVEAVGVVGVVPRRYETPVEYARRASRAIGDTTPAPLAWTLEQADYSVEGIGEEEAAKALELADGIRAAVRAQTSTATRVLAAADPRPPGRRGRRRGPRPTGPRIHITGERG